MSLSTPLLIGYNISLANRHIRSPTLTLDISFLDILLGMDEFTLPIKMSMWYRMHSVYLSWNIKLWFFAVTWMRQKRFWLPFPLTKCRKLPASWKDKVLFPVSSNVSDREGYKEKALEVSTDPEQRFELALQLHKLDVAYQLAERNFLSLRLYKSNSTRIKNRIQMEAGWRRCAGIVEPRPRGRIIQKRQRSRISVTSLHLHRISKGSPRSFCSCHKCRSK